MCEVQTPPGCKNWDSISNYRYIVQKNNTAPRKTNDEGNVRANGLGNPIVPVLSATHSFASCFVSKASDSEKQSFEKVSSCRKPTYAFMHLCKYWEAFCSQGPMSEKSPSKGSLFVPGPKVASFISNSTLGSIFVEVSLSIVLFATCYTFWRKFRSFVCYQWARTCVEWLKPVQSMIESSRNMYTCG